MSKQFQQIQWDSQLRDHWRAILRLAVREDLGDAGDWTTRALVPEDAVGKAAVVARQPGIVAGLPGVEMTLREIEPQLGWAPETEDGQTVTAGDRIGLIEGRARGILAAERLLLNLLGRLSGIATLTRAYVEAVSQTKARIHDTRKTIPGWRRLDKYAVRCGGGWNHRTGLFDAVLIKDNHLAVWTQWSEDPDSPAQTETRHGLADAVLCARQFIESNAAEPVRSKMIVEVEVDTLEQLELVLPADPDVVLLDNMSPAELRKAVTRRDACNPAVELEASGGISLETVGEIASAGVDRISVGALTHSAVTLDVGLDWLPAVISEANRRHGR